MKRDEYFNIELSRTNENGNVCTRSIFAKTENGRTVAYIIDKEYTSTNIWGDDNVWKSSKIKRCVLAKSNGAQGADFVREVVKYSLQAGLDVEKEIVEFADRVDEISIALPEKVLRRPEDFHISEGLDFMLQVKLNGEDVSKNYGGFWTFGTHAVDLATWGIIENKHFSKSFEGANEIRKRLEDGTNPKCKPEEFGDE